MTKEVELPDGSIAEFPDTMSDDQIAAVLRRQFGSPAPAPAAPAPPADPQIDRLLKQRSEALAAGKTDVARRIEARIAGVQSGRTQSQQGLFGSANVLDRFAAQASGNARQLFSTLGDVVNAGIVYAGQGGRISYDQALGFARGQREGLTEQNDPAVNAGLNIGGAVATGGLAARGAAAALPAAARALPAFVAVPAAGAVQGALSGAVDGRVEGRSVEGALEGGAIGAVAAPIAGAVGSAVRRVAEGVSNIVAPSSGAIRAIARRLDTTVATLQARYNQFIRANGRLPSVVELVDSVDIPPLRKAIERSRRGSLVTSQAADDFRATRSTELSDGVANGQQAVAARTVTDQATDDLTRALGDQADPEALRNSEFTPSAAFAQFLSSELFETIRRQARSPTLNALADRFTNTGRLTVDEADTLRQVLRNEANNALPNDAVGFRRIADRITAETSQAVPAYGSALQRYALANTAAEGIDRGRRVLADDTSQFLAEQASAAQRNTARGANFANADQEGLATGARNALIDTASESTSGAERLARNLADPASGLGDRLSTALGPQEAQRLQELGQITNRSAENLRGIVPQPIQDAQEAAVEAARTVGRVGVAATGRGSGGFLLDTASRLESFLSVPPETAYRLAQALVTPTQTTRVIELLQRQGVTDAQIQELLRAISIGVPAAIPAVRE